jgi:hypothetical protein
MSEMFVAELEDTSVPAQLPAPVPSRTASTRSAWQSTRAQNKTPHAGIQPTLFAPVAVDFGPVQEKRSSSRASQRRGGGGAVGEGDEAAPRTSIDSQLRANLLWSPYGNAPPAPEAQAAEMKSPSRKSTTSTVSSSAEPKAKAPPGEKKKKKKKNTLVKEGKR